jgi:hypothetical protein
MFTLHSTIKMMAKASAMCPCQDSVKRQAVESRSVAMHNR